MTHPLTPREKDADRLCDKVQAEYPNILTALASGSGDHAELARLARIWSDTSVTNHKMPGDTAIVWSRRLDALLAENAALREQHAADMIAMAQAGQNLQSQRLSLTEAERKLAVAMGLLREASSDLETEVEARYDGVKDHPAMTSKYDRDMITPRRINAFLRKEAERG